MTLSFSHTAVIGRIQVAMAMILAGSTVVFSKLVAAHLPTFVANVLVLFPATVILLGLCWIREGGLHVPRQAWLPLTLQALCGVVLFRVFLFYGVPLTSAASAGILTSTVPAVSVVLAWLFLHERWTARSVLGVLMTGLGILVLTVPGASQAVGRDPLLGNLLVMGAVCGEASWNVLSRLGAARLTPLASTAMVSLLALVMFLPLSLFQFSQVQFSSLPASLWWAVAYYALIGTVAAYLCWFAGFRKVSTSTAAVYTGWFPVSAVVCSALVLREPLSLWHGVGLACVLVATFVFAGKGSEERRTAATPADA